MRFVTLLLSMALAVWLGGCGGIAVYEDGGEGGGGELPPSRSRWSFEPPSEGTPNDNGYIGPFCCTGVTAVVVGDDGRELAYAYFYGWRGQAKTFGEHGSFAPDFVIDIAAVIDLEDDMPPVEFARGELAFTAGELVWGLSRTTEVGALRFTATIRDADVKVWSDEAMFRMSTLTVRLDVDPIE